MIFIDFQNLYVSFCNFNLIIISKWLFDMFDNYFVLSLKQFLFTNRETVKFFVSYTSMWKLFRNKYRTCNSVICNFSIVYFTPTFIINNYAWKNRTIFATMLFGRWRTETNEKSQMRKFNNENDIFTYIVGVYVHHY